MREEAETERWLEFRNVQLEESNSIICACETWQSASFFFSDSWIPSVTFALCVLGL